MADLFLVNGSLYSQDPAFPHATAVAIRAGRIRAVGSDDEIRDLAGANAEVIDLEARRVLPALQDAHFHVHDWALGLGRLSLAGVHSLEELRQAVAGTARALPPGRWILGQGWDETHWDVTRTPTGADLDDVRAAMEDLASAFEPAELEGIAYELYEKFRPEIPGGKKGWGAKGELNLEYIRSLGE